MASFILNNLIASTALSSTLIQIGSGNRTHIYFSIRALSTSVEQIPPQEDNSCSTPEETVRRLR
jgi:hypothetical protein